MGAKEIADALAQLEETDSLQFHAALRLIMEVVHNHLVKEHREANPEPGQRGWRPEAHFTWNGERGKLP